MPALIGFSLNALQVNAKGANFVLVFHFFSDLKKKMQCTERGTIGVFE